MEPTTIKAPQIGVGDRIRCTTADHVIHELLVGRIEHTDYLVRPVQSPNTCTILHLSPRDLVTLLDRAPSQSDQLEALAAGWATLARETEDADTEGEGFAAGMRYAALDLLKKIGRGRECPGCNNLTDASSPQCLSCGRLASAPVVHPCTEEHS